jgi:DNA-binding MurR/RpiR family transcriptional regulator|tara:strand:+ start:183 stop:407 length:225 start_codon:yes stop_codon:yes gene_type:complete
MKKYRKDIRKAYELVENAHDLMEQAERVVVFGNDRTFNLISNMNSKMEQLLDDIKQRIIMQDVHIYTELIKGNK